jgi:hypothetical protein
MPVLLNTGGAVTDGVDVTLFFDPGVLQASGITAGSIYPSYPSRQIDPSGQVDVSGTASPGVTFEGIGTVATVTFTVLANAPLGLTQVRFDFDPANPGKTTDSNIAEHGTAREVLSSVTNATLTIGGGSCANPVAPPVISAVQAGNITGSGAAVTWTTDVASDSQVEYGLTTSYGSTTPINASLVTSHSVLLAGLTPGTGYHYRVKSSVSGVASVSGDYTFTTPPTITPTWTFTPTAVSGSNVGVSVSLSGAGQLQATISARNPACTPNNQLQQLQFGDDPRVYRNARILIDGQVRTPPFTLTLPAGTTEKLFSVIQINAGQDATVPLTARDSCGDWQTLVGGGASVFTPLSGSNAAAPASAATATPTPTRTGTPVSTRTPTPAPSSTPTATATQPTR